MMIWWNRKKVIGWSIIVLVTAAHLISWARYTFLGQQESSSDPPQTRGRSTTAPSSSRNFFGKLPSSPSSASLAGYRDKITTTQIKEATSSLSDVNPQPPAVSEERYLIRVFRENGSFTTVGCTLSTTTEELLDTLRRKFFVSGDARYVIRLQCHLYGMSCFKIKIEPCTDIITERTLQSIELPLEIQNTLFKQLGYNSSDGLERLGREDYSYICKFVFKEEVSSEALVSFASARYAFPSRLILTSTLQVQSYFDQVSQTTSYINLSGMDLSHVPKALFERAADIEALSLSKNSSITALPENFAKSFTALRYLAMMWSGLTRIPSGVINLTNLIELDLTGNKITSLENIRFDSLASLQILNLSYNLIDEIPADFLKSLLQLKIFNLSNNLIKKFPVEICSKLAHSLRFLDLSFCNMRGKLPDSLCDVRQLTVFKVAYNRLYGGLPWGMGDLQRLKEVDIRGNNFGETSSGEEAAVMGVLSRCPALEQIKADGNKIRWVGRWRDRAACRPSSDVKGFLKVEPMLSISNNSDMDAGDDLDGEGPVGPARSLEFQKLKILSMRMQLAPTGVCRPLVFRFSNLGMTLSDLDISFCGLQQLPYRIFEKLRCLRSLNLSGNKLSEIPPFTFSKTEDKWSSHAPSSTAETPSTQASNRVGALKLREIVASNNQLRTLPPEIGDLQYLVFLDVQGNQLTYLPLEIWRCGKLKSINASSNKMESLPDPPYEWASSTISSSPLSLAGNEAANYPSLSKRESVSSIQSTVSKYRSLSKYTSAMLVTVEEAEGDNWSQEDSIKSESERETPERLTSANPHLHLSIIPASSPSLSMSSTKTNATQFPPLSYSLETLSLANNHFNEENLYALNYMQSLVHLNLAHNEISDVSSLFMSGNASGSPWYMHLRELYLSGNTISYIPGEIERLRGLQVLFFNGNKLSTVPGELGKLVKLKVLDLGSQFGGKGEGSGLRYNTANWVRIDLLM
jgi:Leucine-rich repeat (LRR) protein